MSNPWTLTIPKDGKAWINSNDRIHRMLKAKRTAQWRATAYVEAIHATPTTFTGLVHVTCTVHKARAGRWDAGNLYPTAKAIVDGLVSAGVLVDDDNTHVIGPDMRAGEKRAQACVVISIEASDDGFKAALIERGWSPAATGMLAMIFAANGAMAP